MPAPNKMHRIAIVLARERRDVPPPLSLVDIPPPDDGIAGARLAISDNNTTGRFLKQEFALEVVQNGDIRELVAQVKRHVEGGVSFIVADLRPQTMVALADALKDQRALILNAGSSDDRLREQDCRPNVVHTTPSRSMLADALAHYVVWKQWRRWFLVYGTGPDDEAFAAALRRAAKRFGAKIVEERPFKYEVGGRRADGGHEQIQQQIPTFTQNAPAYDVLMIADEGGLFGEYCANLQATRLNRANLAGANLGGVTLDQAWALDADLTGASLRGTSLFATQLMGAKLDGADLSDARITGDLSRASMRRARLDRADLSADMRNQSMGLIRGVLRSATLDGASFKNANLSRAVLEFASLRDAILKGANLNGSELGGADFLRADVTNADFENADVTSTRLIGLRGRDKARNLDRTLND